MTTESAPAGTLDLDAYLRRIDYGGALEPTLPALQALHLAHATHIPFENLDILLGRSIGLDLESLQAKLVAGGRGGYCFEQNTLFAAALRALGFDVTLLAARVRFGANRVLPRTHMTLSVRVNDTAWLVTLAWMAARGAGWLRRSTVQRWLERVTGVALIGFGLRLAAQAR